MNIHVILSNINRSLLHPPSLRIEEEILHFFGTRRPARNHERTHGYQLFRLSVAKECKRLGESDEMSIRFVANYLWKTSSRNEKLEYVRLAKMVKFSLEFQE